MTDIKGWLPVIAAILAAGMWLGALEHRVTSLEEKQNYLHGAFEVPKGTP